MIFTWIFSGWPQIWNNPSFPLNIQEAKAAEAAIDTTVSTGGTSHAHFGSQTVFISDQTGYRFYRDSSGECAYSKTTNGGTSWGTAVLVDDQGTGTDCISIAVWYDRWTPGDTTGTNIHIVTMDTGSDSLFYNALDTSTDTRLTGSTAIDTDPGAVQIATNVAGANYPTITKGTDGILYVAEADASDSFVLKCSTTCGTGTNWSEAGTNPMDLANDFNILMPLSGGNILLIDHDISADDNRSKVWNGTGWDASWTAIDASAIENTTYDQTISAAVDPVSNDIYLAYTADDATPGTDDDVRTAVYSGSWTLKTNVFTNSACAGVSNCGLTGVSIAFNQNNKDVYVAYAAETTAGTITTQNIYWKKSTDGMASWSAESAAVNATADDIYGVDLNRSSDERIFVSWDYQTADDIYGDTIANLVPPTHNQSAYRLFNNADSTDVGSALAAQDTAATLGSAGAAFRLRALLHLGGDGARASLNNFKLQFAQQSGTCDTAFSGETYADVTAATLIAYNDNATPADGATLTANANDPTHGGDTIVNQTYEELNNFTNSVAAIPSGQDGKWDFSLIDNGATASTAYCLRTVKSDGTLLDTYTVIPQITTAAGGTIITDIVDAGYVTVGSPTMAMNSATFSFTCQTITGSFGTASQQIYVNNNNGANNGWTLTVAAQAVTNVWDSVGTDYDFNDPTGSGCTDGADAGDTVGGQMTIDPSVATLAIGQCGGCSTANVSKGSSAAFNEGTTDTITLLTATAASDDVGDWTLQGVNISQKIPAEQPAASDYDINMVLTVTAN